MRNCKEKRDVVGDLIIASNKVKDRLKEMLWGL